MRQCLFFIIVFIFLKFSAFAQEAPLPRGGSLRPKPPEYKAEGLDDPFKYAEIEAVKTEAQPEIKKPLPALAIQGIVWGGDFPQAIVNNKVLRIGDTIEEARIVDITKKGLSLSFQGQQYTISSPAAVNINSLPKKPEGGNNAKQF